MAPISCRVKATQFAKVSLLRLWPYHFLPSSSPTQLQPLSPPCCSWNKPSTLLPQGLCTCWSAPRILFPQGAAWLFLPRSLHKCHLFSELILLSITCKRAKPPSPVLVSPLCTCPGRSPSQHVFWVVSIFLPQLQWPGLFVHSCIPGAHTKHDTQWVLKKDLNRWMNKMNEWIPGDWEEAGPAGRLRVLPKVCRCCWWPVRRWPGVGHSLGTVPACGS